LTIRVGVVGAQAALAGVTAGGAWPSDALAEQCRILSGDRRAAQGLLPAAPLPPLPAATVQLIDLVRFFDHPPRAFLRRLGITLPEAEAGPTDHERFDLGGPLDAYQLRKEACAQEHAADELARDWQRRGLIPAGALGRQLAWPLIGHGAALREESAADRDGCAPAEVRVDLGTGRRLVGVCEPGKDALGPVLLHPGKLSAKYQIRTWIHGLAWQAMGLTGAGRCWHLADKGKSACWLAPGAQTAAAARDHLTALVAVMDDGVCRPLPLLPAVVDAWVAQPDDSAGLEAARQCWFAEARSQPASGHDPAARRIWPEPADPFADPATVAASQAAITLLRSVKPPAVATAQGAGP